MSRAHLWIEKLRTKLNHQYGAKHGAILSKKYAQAFSISYQGDFPLQQAIEDINLIERLTPEHPFEVTLYEEEGKKGRHYLKLIQYDHPIPLSDILPILENMDLRTYDERPYKIILNKDIKIWISVFSVSYNKSTELKLSDIKDIFREALISIIRGYCENDAFNKLILGAGLPWRDILILRAYAKYLHQIGFRFSQHYIERTVSTYPDIAKSLILLFNLKFDPKLKHRREKNIKDLEKKIKDGIESVTSLDEDRILRHMWLTIKATLRTNYFQKTTSHTHKKYFSFKLASKDVPELPLPHPLYEIFVYSTRFEAIHLRAAKVARGGIRWSDRREDFRTEILGLMKAQKVKNAIIVPSGAKGGFVLKTDTTNLTREQLEKEVIKCYKSFMYGLLDITDNLKKGKVIKPVKVVCYDDDDPYLVVAADKGTATFSDIANNISKEYDFWLGDAFASGGYTGYDHKKMGITARGAWESIKRHFRVIDLNIKRNKFTVVGIGDMSGDVFGNGMLYCDHIKLVAAFDHRDIFLDPNPEPIKSFKERKRLFNLPISSWQDYDKKLISKGGGIFSRKLKSIPISKEVKAALGITENSLPPNELIRAILKSEVDLLYNGGIGTYVKASFERDTDVGDKTNELCRVNGNELRCRVVGEGGNLGFTQLGRIEYALKGGLINTDFIDNSAGVDCSDHEVNIKILLNKLVSEGKLSEKKRNQLLADMTDEVAKLVLKDNYYQALAMGFSVNHASELAGLYQAYLKELETTGVVDRVVEFLPDDKEILARKASGFGLVSPELAELLAYTKIHLKAEILKSDVPEDPFYLDMLDKAFPSKINKLYGNQLKEHQLKREIIATQISNQLVNEMGITFVYRLQTEMGNDIAEIIRAHSVAMHIFDSRTLDKLIYSLEPKIDYKMEFELLHYVRHLLNLATRWFLRGNRLKGDMNKIINHYAKGVKSLEHVIPDLMVGVTKTYLESLDERFTKAGVPLETIRRIAITRAIYTALNIIEVASRNHFDLMQTAKVYFEVGARFNLVWFRDQIAGDKREGHWVALARLTLRDELDFLQKLLTIVIIKHNRKEKNTSVCIENWIATNERPIERWNKVLEMLYGTTPIEYAMFFISLRELTNWVISTQVSRVEIKV